MWTIVYNQCRHGRQSHCPAASTPTIVRPRWVFSWNCSNPAALKHIPEELKDELKDAQSLHSLPDHKEYTKPWMEYSSSHSPICQQCDKAIPDFRHCQNLWLVRYQNENSLLTAMGAETGLGWPKSERDDWTRWRTKWRTKHAAITRSIVQAYVAVLYLQVECTNSHTKVILVTLKTKVTPIQRLTISRLDLCGAHLLSQLLHHVRLVHTPTQLYAWQLWLSGKLLVVHHFNWTLGLRMSQPISPLMETTLWDFWHSWQESCTIP